ncbi:caspase family protein, partial [Bradyrhizobium sp.]|uniref:caspase family protein n=1 Tax=Bradyrhizobium sp. TaxID=376 RepID=UPI002E0251CC|nr:caspase family protein [Bradyrhizobium sp.]
MRYAIVLLSLICLLFSADAARADRRVAFVVGNGAYKNVQPLPNPPIDAKSMASVLRNVGFEVVEGSNLTRDKMTERLLEFGKKAQGA